MSYVNQDLLKMQKRRHSVRHITPEEAVKVANEVVDKANDQIAKALAHAKAWQGVATNLYEESEQHKQQLAERDKQIEDLEAEIERLKRKVTKRAGKRKGEEWDE
jgi:hypothetical protein